MKMAKLKGPINLHEQALLRQIPENKDAYALTTQSILVVQVYA